MREAQGVGIKNLIKPRRKLTEKCHLLSAWLASALLSRNHHVNGISSSSAPHAHVTLSKHGGTEAYYEREMAYSAPGQQARGSHHGGMS